MFQIVSEVYGVVLRNWRLVFRFGGGPALALGLFMVLSPFLVDLPTAPAEGETVTVTASGALAGMVAILVMSGLSLWLVVAHAIRWHRFALYGEQPANPLRLEFGARGWRYLWASFIVSMLSLAAILPLMALGGGLMGAGAGGMALGLLSVMAASMYVLGRVGLILPAAAADQSMGIGASWSATAGRGGAFAGLLLAVVIPPALVFNTAQFVVAGGPEVGRLGTALGNAIGLVGLLFSTALAAAALSRCYIAVFGMPAQRPGTVVDTTV